MTARKPQINFQVSPSMKLLYEEAKAGGHWVTRLCAAGFLYMVTNPRARREALTALREWEARYGDASEADVQAFVEGAQSAMRSAAPGTPPARKARRGRKKAKRGKSA